MFSFDNTYARELQGFYVACLPTATPQPHLLRLNRALAEELGLHLEGLDDQRLAAIFSGNEVPEGASSLAQAYAGHQFGGFSPQLGDGRALLLGEVIDRHGQRRDIAFKGSGRTPYSRRGDGKAAVGPVLREYLLGEAMHAMGVPTTRALAAVATGEPVFRERALPGAVLTRVAASHLRVGTFEYFAAQGDHARVRQLADYAIARHYPDLVGDPNRYLELLRAVSERQAALVARWMLVGFIHGVMNTDNMAISGETIDYGPCAFLESFNPRAVFSSIDSGGRYAYGNQPAIAQWNLTRFAETLLTCIDPVSPDRAIPAATDALEAFPFRYQAHWLSGVRARLGLGPGGDEDEDFTLANDWLALLFAQSVDYTLAWRRLADAAEGNTVPLSALFTDGAALSTWLERWSARCDTDGVPAGARANAMRLVSPIHIPRNHIVEEALTAASDEGDLGPFDRLVEVLARPFEERPGLQRYATPARPEVTASYRTFCGT
ncbi:MAG TPA: YdiU family protein [Vicinamibacterales bacterium]